MARAQQFRSSIETYALRQRTWGNLVLGAEWVFCTILIQTGSQVKEGNRISICDDVNKQVFTVTMRNLEPHDSGWYWCAVEIGGKETPDDRTYLYLTVTDDTAGLTVANPTVTAEEGKSVSVQCHYSDRHTNSVKMWCKSECRSSCKTADRTGSSVLIRDYRAHRVFIVTLGGLQRRDTGWYRCVAAQEWVPVYLNVTEATVTSPAPAPVLFTSTVPLQSSALPSEADDRDQQESSSSEDDYRDANKSHINHWKSNRHILNPLLITLGLLILLVIGVIVTGMTWNKCNRQ
ncbi:polymeric immunoglobulin receptor-like [Lepisosteus oculatus]|uniref:polymeric immunoglobulin receptor-like n=1 Tax=Lepisosteus oculatus TaxID=7918 RepID=UPI0035F520E4